ncbi:E3 ubiquitin-protein ligase RNF213-like isoform X2 [Saccostrea cucullata]|uniref:E3 ubiquitin-protein ligase RNF213-like isoform X2 n=1 Tax=Saccostrea cuccullata TaxID=36930 RepID=UPI002ED522C5
MDEIKVKCPTKGEDGRTCDVDLLSWYKRCPACEKKVDPKWFTQTPVSAERHPLDDKNGNASVPPKEIEVSDVGNPITQETSNGVPNPTTETTGRPPEQIQENTNTRVGQSNNSSANQPNKTTRVVFHAFLASTVALDLTSKKDQNLFVVFGPTRDNWDHKPEGLMTIFESVVNRKKDQHGTRVVAEVDLEKDLLRNGLSYRYCFQKKDSMENEFLFQQFYPYHSGERILRISPEIDCYHQYDGYIYAKKSGNRAVIFFKEMFGVSNSSMIEIMCTDGKHALKQYLPDIRNVIEMNNNPSTIIATMDNYQQVFRGCIKDHFMLYRYHYDPTIWQKIILEDHLGATINALESNANKQDENQRFMKAISLVKLLYCMGFSYDLLDYRTVEKIHQALLLSAEEKNTEQLDYVERNFSTSMKQQTKKALIWFLQKSAKNVVEKTERNPFWIACLPVIHFLDGSLHPFEELDYKNFDDKQKGWWSVGEFEATKDELKLRTWSRSIPDMISLLKPLFILDTKTQRGFMACLDYQDLEWAMMEESILIEIKLATLLHYFDDAKYSSQMDNLGKGMEKIVTCFKNLLESLSCKATIRRDLKDIPERFKIQQEKCVAILSIGVQKRRIIKDKRMLVSLFHCNMLSLAVLEKHCSEADVELKSLQKRTTYLINDILLCFGNDLSLHDFALSILGNVKQTELSVEWKENCLLHAENMFKAIDDRKRVEIYSKIMKDCQSESLRNLLQKILMESIDAILEGDRICTLLNDLNVFVSTDVYTSQFLSKIFSEMWKIELDASENEFIHLALNSPIYPKCLEAYLYKTRVFADMNSAAKEKLQRSVTIMKSLFHKLSKNDLHITCLELICSRKETFISVATVFENHENISMPLTISALNNMLMCREKDLNFAEEIITTVEKLQFLFKDISARTNIPIKEIDDAGLRNWKMLEIQNVCKIPEESIGCSQYQPKVILFQDLLSRLQSFVKNIVFYTDSKSFHKILRITARNFKNAQNFGFDDVVDKILMCTKNIWDDLCTKIENGTISIREIEKYGFSELSDENLKTELVAMNRGRKHSWIKERIEQLHRFRQFSKTVAVAKLLLDVRGKYSVDGSFEKMELIANSETKKDISLTDLKIEVQTFNERLGMINSKQKESIVSFLRSSELVQWLRGAMPGGVKDLKIYADLALLSVEGDDQVGRVTTLHSATIGYSPMIFSLGSINGESDLMLKWEEVWQSLEKDDSLPQKLKISNDVLHWYIEIKESHGSVEVTSLKQVDAIKERGIFKVGHYRGTVVKNKHQLELDDVIWLHVPGNKHVGTSFKEERSDISDTEQSDSDVEIEEESNSLKLLKQEKLRNREEGRDYSLGEMTDLQSRLMLVTGKADAGRESIERFTSIFDNVTRLGKVFIQLHASGCILFKQWTFEFHCNQSAGSSVLISTNDRSVVKGTNFPKVSEDSKEIQSNVNEYIRGIADFLEKCYEEWIKYIREKRSTFYPLNFFTVDQMVVLQEEIAQIRNGNGATKFLCPLLSLVKSNCSLRPDLEDAINTVQEKLLTQEQTAKMDDVSEMKSHAEAIQRFLKVADQASVSRKHALRAIKSQEFDIEDTSAGLLWCLTNDENEEDEENSVLDQTTEKDETIKDSTIGDKMREFMEELEEKLRQQEIDQVILSLDQTWKKFLDCASSSATDFLSIDHLGMILETLYEQGNGTIKRTLLDPLKCGKPNLIVCPRREILPMVLTLYMTDQNLPLPSRNEVLLCTDSTTKEEVTIFFRRALFQNKEDPNKLLFCLMNADMLQYDASEQSLKEVTEYIKAAKGDYKLVIICASENEYKSPMVSALDKFRASKITTAAPAKLREYLRKKYTIENISEAAASIDPSRCCVRIVKSERAGLGKTLYKNRLVEKLLEKHTIGVGEDFALSITIPISQKQIDKSEVSKKFLESTMPDDLTFPRIFHIDIAYGVERFVGAMLFNILILGSTVNDSGYVFRRSENDLFIIETTLPDDHDQAKEFNASWQLLNILPCVTCISPEDSLRNVNEGAQNSEFMVGFDKKKFQSDEWQRPFHYLKNNDARTGNIPVFNTHRKGENMKECLSVLTRHCCLEDPSWAELRNFVHFLNTQLKDFEKSAFCGSGLSQDLPGFQTFVLRFLIQMSKDFSTRSLVMSEGKTNCNSDYVEEVGDLNRRENDDVPENNADLQQFQMRRRWETSAHPYLFFNPDHHSLTFIGFNIDRAFRNLVDQQTGAILEKNIMSRQLWEALQRNRVPLQEDFNGLSRKDKIERLCSVIGNDMPQDPDDTYELTTDNVKKMLAIYMRFRCNIPVIVMGETGCGKTCLIKFLCSLQCPAGLEGEMNTMTLMKVHGGTSKKHIIEKVKQAESLAQYNCDNYGKHIITVLFFDEANTTEAVGCIKEIMCDGTIDGQPLALNTNLKLVAACNPYRKHSQEMIERLERAGLGYHVNADETDDKLGRIPMRHLVYRVQPLPQSMLPLVWDFGQLDNYVEKLYIVQMVQRCVRSGSLPNLNRKAVNIISSILTASQEFMRKQNDECSFVSLRDVERTLKVFGWFYNQHEIFAAVDRLEESEVDEDIDEIPRPVGVHLHAHVMKMTRSLLLALGVCYHSSLKSREKYIEYITKFFESPLQLSGGAQEMEREITRCQMAFLHNVNLNDNIAKNLALRENFFMMVICVELRIPLFLVGKPGSSKSLSKTILDHNMQGRDSQTSLFKSLKQIQLISFQCSPLATADGILKTFKQASSFQKNKDLDRFVSVVVLDEVGLAEDSPRMPLKALHPLLEDGCPDDEEFEEYKKVSFIGISNWALDPAKMNRGILVQREVPDEQDLVESAKGICHSDNVYQQIEHLIPPLAKGYLRIFEKACNCEALFGSLTEDHLKAREFFGLRDFYSLVKMICAIAAEKRRSPDQQELVIAIKRNFGGLEGLDPVQEFGHFLPDLSRTQLVHKITKTDTALLRECLRYEENKKESRYILLLTENYGALNLLHQLMGNEENTHIIFGSSFPRDQEYIEICRNINRIKVFMETGKTVVLLNLENLYESLYDALNQYYMESGPDRYIDLGLGTHRVKCKVDKRFRLVVVAEKRIVYREFPIPLINRLEKHFLTMEGMLTDIQLKLSKNLEEWAKDFICSSDSKSVRIEEVFIGYNKDTSAGVILKAWDMLTKGTSNDEFTFQNNVMESARDILLWGCTPDAVLRLKTSRLQIFADAYFTQYFRDQCHESLCDFLQFRNDHGEFGGNFIQITTHSKLMSVEDKRALERTLPFLSGKIAILSLQAFDTEQQFSYQIRETSQKGTSLLLVQCDTGDENSNLVECARHCVQREIQSNALNLCVIFLVHLSRVSKHYFSGFQTGLWTSVHIDELRSSSLPSIETLMSKTISSILMESLSLKENFVEESGDETTNPNVMQERHANLRTILFNCIHPALASIGELDEEEGRSIGRIRFIFKELSKNKNLIEGQFGHGLMKHIVTILSKQNMDKDLQNQSWMHSEAATAASINKTGTLRSSCLKIIEEKVTPLLANIVAFVDTNKNISILENNSDEMNWIANMWLGIFNNMDVDAFGKLKVPKVISTGAGHLFTSSFPFSWLIYDIVERLILVTSENEIGKTAEELFLESSIGNFIIQNLIPERINEATKLYMLDFIHMAHNTRCVKEEKIVCECLRICFEDGIVHKEDNFASRIFCIHAAFRKIKPKLETFSEVLNLVSEADDSFYQKVQNDCKELDIMAVKYLLDAMEPNEMSIDTQEGQRKWIQNVQRYRPVIEQLLHGSIGDQTTGRGRHIQVLRAKWSKVVVLKLFVQNLCVETHRERLTAQTCKILWMIMGDNTNLKEKATLEKLEKFLKASNSKAMTEFLGKFGKCNNCEKPFDSSPPVVLPCKHRICREDCFSLINALPTEDKTCPVNKCSKSIPDEFNENETPENQKEQMKLFKEYQEKCNRFYMQVVSQLCFEDSSPPSEDVCKHLLQLVVHKKEIPQLNMTIIRTRQMTIFETVVDTTPVFRSFLLQLLIRTNEEVVFRHLDDFLQEADAIFQKSGNTSQELDLCLMLIQCIEDSLVEQSANLIRYREIECIESLIMNVTKSLQSKTRVIDKIQSIAAARFCLEMIAKYLKESYSSKSVSEKRWFEELFRKAAILCDLPIDHLRVFLLTHICRSYGLDLYHSLLKSEETWIFPFQKAEKPMQECPDYFIVLGDTYREIRENIAECLLVKEKRVRLKVTARSVSVQFSYLLALIKELKMKEIYSNGEMEVTGQFVEGLKGEFTRQNLQIVLTFLDDVLGDSFAKSCKHLQIRYHQDLKGQGIVLLIIHFLMVLKTLSSNEILQPFVLLATHPKTMKGSFLPTMPEEGLSAEIKAELQRMEELANKHYHTVTWYRCPNGHPYAVGDCGNPTQLGHCYQCKAEIGGQSSKLKGDNVKDTGSDFSQPGHILGSPDGRGSHAMSERTLSPASTTLLRLITHIAMFIGANEHLDDVCGLIQPVIPSDMVPDFLWEHISKDIDILRTSLDRSIDDLFMFLHSTIQSFVENDTSYSGIRGRVTMQMQYDLSTKKGRSTWETDIDRMCISRKLQTHQEFFDRCTELLSNDRSIGSDPFLKLAFNKNTSDSDTFSMANVELSPSVWQHRKKVTFEQFVHEFHAMIKDRRFLFGDRYFVLNRFLQQEFYLRHLHHIPKVLQMQKLLLSKYGRQITREEATEMTLQNSIDHFHDDPAQEIIAQGVSSVCELWNSLRHSIALVLPFERNDELRALLQRDICTETDSLRVVLPESQGIGVCIRIIFEFLIGKQNEFITAINSRFQKSQKVTVDELAPTHFIGFKRETDIFPIVLANCNYTYMQDESTKVEYDFENIQAVLQDRILFGKAVIDTSGGFTLMMYKADASVSSKFTSLALKVPQEALNRGVQSQITMEFSDLPDVYKTIGNIDTVVNFLLSMNYPPDLLLNSFMEETLQMKPLSSHKAAQCCKLCHVKSLWFLLTFEKTKRLHHSEKEAFDSINKSIQEEIPAESNNELDIYLSELSLEKLEIFLEQLLECILFTLNCGEGDIGSYQHRLSDSLMVHLESPEYLEVDLKSFRLEDLEGLPADILAVHSVEVWKRIHRYILSGE